jgi:hypothetical protein
MTLATRRKCHGTCGTWFSPSNAASVYCPECLAKSIDKALGTVYQDNSEPLPFLTPLDAMTRAQIQIHNAQLMAKCIRLTGLLGRLYGTLSAISAPGIFPVDARKLAQHALDMCDRDYADIAPEIGGEAYRREG